MLPARRSCVQSSETEVSATKAVTGRAMNAGICGTRGVRHGRHEGGERRGGEHGVQGEEQERLLVGDLDRNPEGRRGEQRNRNERRQACEREGEPRRPAATPTIASATAAGLVGQPAAACSPPVRRRTAPRPRPAARCRRAGRAGVAGGVTSATPPAPSNAAIWARSSWLTWGMYGHRRRCCYE